VKHGVTAHLHFVSPGGCPRRGIDNPTDFVVPDHIQYVRSSFTDLEHGIGLHPRIPERGCSALGRVDCVPHLGQFDEFRCRLLFVLVAEAGENRPRLRKRITCSQLALDKSHASVNIDPHDFPGGLHFRAQDNVRTGKADER